MALVAEFVTPTEAFAAGRAFADCPVNVLELERVVPTDDAVVPFLWAWGDDLDAYETRLAEEVGGDCVHRLADADGGRLYRIEWIDGRSGEILELFEHEFTLLSGVCTDDGWTFEIRFPSSDAAAAFRQELAASSISYDLTKVTKGGSGVTGRSYGLTSEQQEILAVAAEEGYFEEPRQATLADVAAELGISVSAASGRLRRAHGALVGNTVLDDLPAEGSASVGPHDAPP